MTDKIFAPDTEQDAKGRYIFPKDATWRKEMLHPDVMNHPAKNNMHLIDALVEYLTEPGDTILDPFGGVGSMVPAVLKGRRLILIEIEEYFANMLRWAEDKYGHIAVIQNDCRQALPIACDHAIFSPPFADSLKGSDLKFDPAGRPISGVEEYSSESSSKLNLGLLNEFFFNQAMFKIYKLLAQSVKPSGRVAIITRDSVRTGAMRMIAQGVTRGMTREGFRMNEWIRRKVDPSVRAVINLRKGGTANDEEDILLFTKE